MNSLCITFNSVRVIIYCSNRRNVDELALQLERLGHSVLSMVIHKYIFISYGKWSNTLFLIPKFFQHVESVAVREQVSKYFSAGCCNMLITCNYLGYEFELPKSVVINYDLPQNPANYKSRWVDVRNWIASLMQLNIFHFQINLYFYPSQVSRT